MRFAHESAPILLALLLAALAGWLFLPNWLGVVFAPIVAYVLWFFRDPQRSPPADPTAILSPADGEVLIAGPQRIAIFLNIFNVHVCRAPIAGRVRSVVHHAGSFVSAFKDEASEHNERVVIELDAGARQMRLTLVAGLIARRIVCRVVPGQTLAAGERIGVIRFGSRVDLDLPPDASAAVRVGQGVRAGESVLARWNVAIEAPAGGARGSATGFPI